MHEEVRNTVDASPDAYASAEALYRRGHIADALSLLERSALTGTQAPMLNLAAACCLALQRPAQAEAYCRRAIDISPDFADAHSNLGVVLQRSGRVREAEAAYRRVLTIRPNHAPAHTNLGRILEMQGAFDAARTSHLRALECNPDEAAAHTNLGACCMQLERFDEAEAAFRHAASLAPHDAGVHFNLGTALKKLVRFEEAEHAYRRALTLRPDHTKARINLAHVLLGTGQMHEGWALFEARYERDGWFEPPRTGIPMWRGESLAGKSLIVWTEQGFGDSLQFCRYLPMLKAQGLAKLTFVCPAPLRALFSTLDGVDACITIDDKFTAVPPHDYQCLLMSAPHYCGTTLESVPAALPYLRVPPERARAWRNTLPAGGFKVGLVWAGDPRNHSAHLHAVDRLRSLSAQAYLPILRVPGATFISLQKGASTQPQIDALPAALRPVDLMNEVKDFADTAAIIEQLDLVITVDTSVAHLAGALNRPVWILSRYDGCWRWLYEGDDSSPWYPRARLFRQTRPGEWDDVIGEVEAALRGVLAAR
ncbi:tetratricopeptide repeat protein [Caballeronia insecticola]|uniref:TPR repeat-containing protein n=1 Tax=Caballeronia insecticola TaxID=758793 RepID=R4WFC1_9BURK|nr:tetratricopeptide repeat-containing glycosyltransferase family protein [Caballeronia insecticola]BAN22278.1 TPR repeat-containing protein [Caballeronia insecticola]